MPKFLLLDTVCQVAKTHEPLLVSRKEIVEHWIEEGIVINGFKILTKPTNYKRKSTYCEIGKEDKVHLKVRLSNDYKSIYYSCLIKCSRYVEVKHEKCRHDEI